MLSRLRLTGTTGVNPRLHLSRHPPFLQQLAQTALQPVHRHWWPGRRTRVAIAWAASARGLRQKRWPSPARPPPRPAMKRGAESQQWPNTRQHHIPSSVRELSANRVLSVTQHRIPSQHTGYSCEATWRAVLAASAAGSSSGALGLAAAPSSAAPEASQAGA